MADQSEGFILAGDVSFATINPTTGLPGAFFPVGNSTKFEVKASVQKKQSKSRQRADYGSIKADVRVGDGTELTISLGRLDKKNLARQLLAEESALTQSSGTVSDQPVVMALGGWVPLDALSISDFELTNSAGSTTYVLGTDYQVNLDLGMVMALEGGAIADAATCKASFTKPAITDGVRLLGGNKVSSRVAILLDGQNIGTRELVTGWFWDVTLAADDALDLLNENLSEIKLSGALTKPANKPSAYAVDIRQPA